ncbi:MAG: histidine phosphatase family protein [Pseudomonadota bacterium]
MKNKTFTLLRHGKVNGEAALYGHTDIELSEQDRSHLGNAIAKIHAELVVDNITASPLLRCAIAAQEFSVKYQIPLQLDPQLKEMHFGVWDGIPFAEMGDQWQQLETFWESPFLTHPPAGETLAAFAERVIDAWENLVKSNSGQHALIICHGGVIRIILAHILQIDWRNASLFKQLHIDFASNSRIEIGNFEGALPVVKWIGVVSA